VERVWNNQLGLAEGARTSSPRLFRQLARELRDLDRIAAELASIPMRALVGEEKRYRDKGIKRHACTKKGNARRPTSSQLPV